MVIIFGSCTSADIYFTHYVCNICCKATSVKILRLHCITFAFPLKYVPQSSKYDSLSKIYRFSGLERRVWTKDRAFTHNLSSLKCETLSGQWNGPEFEAMLKQTKQERSFQGFVKVKKWVLAHSQLLSLCFFICHRFLSLSHSHPCSTFSSKMDLNSNLTPPLVIFSSTIDFDSNLTLPPLRQQELQNLRPGAWDPRESWARCRGQRNHSCQVIVM